MASAPRVDHMITLVVRSHLDPAVIRTQLVYGSLCQNVPTFSVPFPAARRTLLWKVPGASSGHWQLPGFGNRTKGRSHSKDGNRRQREQTDGRERFRRTVRG